jgi:ribosomal protein S18 acetylase RimI-like enzyme
MKETMYPTRRTSPVRIRNATIADAPAIAAIHVRSWIATYATPPSDLGIDVDIAHRTALWERRLQQEGIGRQTSVAVEEGAVTGFIYFGPSPDAQDDPVATGQVFSLHVEPELTNRGIGRRLTEHAVGELRAAGCSSATLWVVATNRQSRVFYERLGWRPDGKRRWEELAMEGEQGDEVEVVRYCLKLAPHGGSQ